MRRPILGGVEYGGNEDGGGGDGEMRGEVLFCFCIGVCAGVVVVSTMMVMFMIKMVFCHGTKRPVHALPATQQTQHTNSIHTNPIHTSTRTNFAQHQQGQSCCSRATVAVGYGIKTGTYCF